jgi:hypothetical protein
MGVAEKLVASIALHRPRHASALFPDKAAINYLDEISAPV